MAGTVISRRNVLVAGAATLGAAGIGGALAIRSRPAPPEDNITLDALLAAAPAPALERIATPAGAARLHSFAGSSFDPGRDDVSGALERASEWSARTGRAVIIGGVWQLRNPAVLSHAGATLIFLNAELRVRDDGRWITTRFPRTLPLAFYITADRVSLLGHCILTGLGRPGRSFLQGVYFDQVEAPILGRFTLRNMAVGVHFMCCEAVECGFVDAYSMWGLQGSPEDSNGAGSAQVVSGCRRSRFAGLRSLRSDKSARYLSVGRAADGASRDNIDNRFGPAEVEGRPGSLWSHVTGVRSSVNSRYAGGVGRNVSFLMTIEKYDTDDAYHVDGNDFGDWSGTIIDPPASSVDAALNIWVAPGNATPVGANRFGRLSASMAPIVPTLIQRLGYGLPANFGVYTNSGRSRIERATFDGFTYHIHIEDSGLAIGALASRNMARQPIRYGRGADLRIGTYAVVGDSIGPGRDRALIGPIGDGVGPPPRLTIEQIDVRRAMPAERTDYVVEDDGAPDGSIRVGRVLGRMRKGGVRIGGVERSG